jgi:hypothetical protein
MLHKDYYRKGWVGKESLVVGRKGLIAKTNWLAVNDQSWSNSNSDSKVSQRIEIEREKTRIKMERVFLFFLWRYSPNLGFGLPPWNPPFHFGFLDLRQSIGLLGWVISSSQDLYMYTYTEKRTQTNAKHPCPEWNSNPRFRLPSERRQCMT